MSTTPTSSAVVFSGYHPIEVTASEFERTVESHEDDYSRSHKSSGGKKGSSHPRRTWGLLSSSRKKKDQDPSDGRQSVSGVSITGQQSVASKTVDSGTTIKASNRHHCPKNHPPKPLQSSNHELAEPTFSKPSNSKEAASNKSWKSLKRLVGKGRHHHPKHAPPQPLASSALTAPSSSDGTEAGAAHTPRKHAKSHDGVESLPTGSATATATATAALDATAGYPLRKRFHSEGVPLSRTVPEELDCHSQHAVDRAIGGRWDGMDVLSLGPARRSSLPQDERDATTTTTTTSTSTTTLDPLHVSFTAKDGQSPVVSPATLVDEMIWTSSAGMDQAELLLEGFYPGGNHRWGVRIATQAGPQAAPPPPSSDPVHDDAPKDTDPEDPCPLPNCTLTSDTKDTDESTATSHDHDHDPDGSTQLPMAELWESLWGVVGTPPPIPSHMNLQTAVPASSSSSSGSSSSLLFPWNYHHHQDPLSPEEEENQQFAAMCNVPVDLDEDAFMIDNPQHVQSIHEVVMIPLQVRRFACALSILEKLVRGLEGTQTYVHLMASTHHNIGMIQLCQGKYPAALQSFQTAVELRHQCLPPGHPDIAVSLQRQGMAQFAMGGFLEALKSFEAALALCPSMDHTRAKILNNIGVARYQLDDCPQALKSFTSALELLRPWLEGPVRRTPMVYSACTILSNMGKAYLREGDHDLAYFCFEEACLMQTSMVRMDHAWVWQSMDNMARAHTKSGKHAEALALFESLHKAQRQKLGPHSAACIESLGMVGISRFKLLDYEEAEDCMKAVQAWQRTHGSMDESHPSVKITTDHIRQIRGCLQGTEPVWV